MSAPSRAQVVVIGGGPAGSTAAALLARDGIDVLLLEREQFPRYHIGESLLASCLPTLRMSGAFDKVAAAGFTVKRGAMFHWGADEWLLDWAKLVDPDAWSWQVDRARYDEILLRNAADQGVTVIEQATVRRVEFEGDRPVGLEFTDAGGATHRVGFDFLVDASGRTGVLARQHFNMRTENELFRNIGVWGYWRGARLLPGSPPGAINVLSRPDGWFWHIPLAGESWSVGLVVAREAFTRDRSGHDSLKDYYLKEVAAHDGLRDLLADATFSGEVRAEQDYSYVAERFAGPGHIIIGDAAAFLDPLLSTGVHLAQYSALVGAAAIATTLSADLDEARALGFFEYTYQRAYNRMLSLVGRMYREYIDSDDYFRRAQPLSDTDDSPAAAFTRISTGLTDLGEAGEQQPRVSSAVIGTSTRYMGGIDMAPVWDFWRDPLGTADTVMGELRLVVEPRLRIREGANS